MNNPGFCNRREHRDDRGDAGTSVEHFSEGKVRHRSSNPASYYKFRDNRSIAYKYKGSLYLNLTNKCTAACTFCIKNRWKGQFRGHYLKLDHEPSAMEVIKLIKNPLKFGEIVFCGYGEPLLKLEILKEVAAWVKLKGGKTRINTSGHANLYHKRNILPELKGLIDAISISLNADNAALYEKLHRPIHGKKAFKAMLEFARESK
jgi:TatD DNase family protein